MRSNLAVKEKAGSKHTWPVRVPGARRSLGFIRRWAYRAFLAGWGKAQLFSLAFGNGVLAGDDDALYFAAAPDGITHGLFGSLRSMSPVLSAPWEMVAAVRWRTAIAAARSGRGTRGRL